MAQNNKKIKQPDPSKVKISTPLFDKLEKENARREQFQQTFKMPKHVKTKVKGLLAAAIAVLGGFQAVEAATSVSTETNTPEKMCTIATPNDDAKIDVDGKSYKIDKNSFIIISDNEALAYDENGNIHQGYVSATDFTEVRQMTEQEMDNYTICQVTAQSGVNVRSTGAIEDDNIISTVSSQDYVLAYTNTTETEGQWISTLSVSGDNIYEGYIYGDYLEVIRDIDEPEIPENPMVVDTSKVGNPPLKLRYEPDEFTSRNILRLIPNGTIISVIGETITAGDREWTNIEYKESDGTIIEGWVATEYLTPYVQKTVENHVEKETVKEEQSTHQLNDQMQEINKSEYNIQVNANGSVTGIDFSGISPDDLRELFQNGIPDQVTVTRDDYPDLLYDTSSIAGNINFAYIKLGASPYGKNAEFKPFEYDNYVEQVKACEELGIPYGFYYYSTATTVEEAHIELEYIKQAIEDLRQKYNLEHNKLEIVVDIELEGTNNRQYQGDIKEQTEAKAALINGIQELRLSDNVLIYGPIRVMRPDLDRIIDLEYLHSLLHNPDDVALWLCLPAKTNGEMDSSLEKYTEYVEQQGFPVVAYQIVLDGKVIGQIDINTMDLEHLEKLLEYENKISQQILSQASNYDGSR